LRTVVVEATAPAKRNNGNDVINAAVGGVPSQPTVPTAVLIQRQENGEEMRIVLQKIGKTVTEEQSQTRADGKWRCKLINNKFNRVKLFEVSELHYVAVRASVRNANTRQLQRMLHCGVLLDGTFKFGTHRGSHLLLHALPREVECNNVDDRQTKTKIMLVLWSNKPTESEVKYYLSSWEHFTEVRLLDVPVVAPNKRKILMNSDRMTTFFQRYIMTDFEVPKQTAPDLPADWLEGSLQLPRYTNCVLFANQICEILNVKDFFHVDLDSINKKAVLRYRGDHQQTISLFSEFTTGETLSHEGPHNGIVKLSIAL